MKSLRLLAVASGGGHWIELLRLRPAFDGANFHYVTVRDEYRSDVPGACFSVVCDATQWDRLKLVWQALQILWIVVRVRPDVVISTGAAPGYFAVRIGRLLGARTIWVDSLANVEELSTAGRMAGKHADLWLTQWPELAHEGGPEYAGKVI